MNSSSNLLRRIPAPVRAAFFACLILGFVTHLFVFTNLIPNSDGLDRIFDEQQMTISGRWFLHYASWFHGFLQAPALIGVLSLLFLGLAAGCTADLLELRSPASGVLVGGVMALFPSLAYTYLYTFTASAYCLAIALAASSVWLFRRRPRLFWASSLMLACSVGTYQAYFALAAGLALSRVLLDLIQADRPVEQTIRSGFGVLGMLALGAAAYYVLLQLFLWAKDLTLLSYLGMDDYASSLSLGGILGKVLSAYRNFFYFFLSPGSFGYNTLPLILVHLLLLGLCALAVLRSLRGRPQEPLRLGLLALGIGLLPLAVNFTELLNQVTPLMRYSFVLVYVLAIALIDQAPQRPEGRSLPLKKIACAGLAVGLLLFAQICNLAYTASSTAHRATNAFAVNLVGRVESTPGYQSGMEVVIVGSFPDDVYYSTEEAYQFVTHYSCLPDSVLLRNKHIYYYLNGWLNVPWAEPAEETFLEISQSDAFQSMALYPSDGSVQILDGRVVVKLAETYTPKEAFEIAYEQRK